MYVQTKNIFYLFSCHSVLITYYSLLVTFTNKILHQLIRFFFSNIQVVILDNFIKLRRSCQFNRGFSNSHVDFVIIDELRRLEQPSLLSRAIFLTDMESGPADEARVIQGAFASSII